MFLCFFATLHQHLEEFTRFFPFLVDAYYGFYGVASALEPSLSYPFVYFLKSLLRQSKLNLSQRITVNNTVYTTLKPLPENGQTTPKPCLRITAKRDFRVCQKSKNSKLPIIPQVIYKRALNWRLSDFFASTDLPCTH